MPHHPQNFFWRVWRWAFSLGHILRSTKIIWSCKRHITDHFHHQIDGGHFFFGLWLDPTLPLPATLGLRSMFHYSLGQISTLLWLYCYKLWHIYPLSTLVDRVGAAAVTLITKEIPLRLLVEKKVDVTMDSKGCQNQIFNNPVTCHGGLSNWTKYYSTLPLMFDTPFTWNKDALGTWANHRTNPRTNESFLIIVCISDR